MEIGGSVIQPESAADLDARSHSGISRNARRAQWPKRDSQNVNSRQETSNKIMTSRLHHTV